MSGTKIATAHPHSFQSGPLSFMSCTSGRESSPMDENDCHQATEFKTETKKKRFHPLRNLRRMFRRKTRRSSISADSYQVVGSGGGGGGSGGVPVNPEIPATNLEQRSCSTSRLQEENLTQNLIRNSRLNPGLSLSHDSIFTPDRADSGLSSSDLENSSLSITILTPPSRECPMKSQSSCSETSLLSIGSSEVELSPVRGIKTSDLDLGVTAYKLSHSAAKHKMAVKPRRNHGAPRSRRRTMTSKSPLPTTLEVSEEGVPGRSSPAKETLLLETSISEPLPNCDKRISETKISWSQTILEPGVNELEEKSRESPKPDDDSDAKEEEVANQKAESFFGRFLSRRSEKKKKFFMESNSDEGGDEKATGGHFAKKFPKSNEGKGGAGKTPNRRQRMDPVEIPSSSLIGKNEFGSRNEKEDFIGRKMSNSVSPPKTYWPSQGVTSRSISPPKVVWPENFSCHVKHGGQIPSVWDRTKRESSDVSPTENLLKDFKNPNFVKELTNSVSLFVKDESAKRKKIEDEDAETVLKMRRQNSDNEAEKVPKTPTTGEVAELKKKSNSSESIESVKSSNEENERVEIATPQEELRYINFRNQFPVSYESIHDGYENIQIIELVKQETRNSVEGKLVDEKKEENVLVAEKTKANDSKKEAEVKKEPEVVMRRVKPLVSEKPKDLKRTGTPEFMKVSLNRVEPKAVSELEPKTENIVPKSRATLVERRKSELMLLTEAEEKDWKAKIKPLKKQTSFSETSIEKESPEGSPKCLVKDEESFPEKTENSPEVEVVEEVVLRKKSVASMSDDQPELMKVFARRSLKVRESEKIVEDMQRSRDSDKENEIVESPKEDRKKIFETAEEKKEQEREGNRTPIRGKISSEVKVNVTSLKPEVVSRKCVFQRYGRSLSENNAKQKDETDFKGNILDDNKMNKMRNITEISVSCNVAKEEKEDEDEEETGFKRIQQRKAEWERRAQQSAK